jgi:ATP-dependent RNA helicase DDX21
MKNEIKISENQPSDFDFFRISDPTIETLKSKNITSLFPIQSATFDYLYDKNDLIGRDRTGSGKTLAFSLPILERFRSEKLFFGHRTPKMLILVPTRELANQIKTTLNDLKNNPKEFNVLAVYGGTSISQQINALENGVDIVVATPGRLIDLSERRAIEFKDLQTIVFDETDEMLKIGFQKDIEFIMKEISYQVDSSKLQYLLFSATVPNWVAQIAREFLNPKYIYINMVQNNLEQTSTTVQHFKFACNNYKDKIKSISDFVSIHVGLNGKAIIFVDKKSNHFIFQKIYK